MTDIDLDVIGAAIDAPSPALVLDERLRVFELGAARFAATVLERAVPHLLVLDWPTAAESLDPLAAHALATGRTEHAESVFADLSMELDGPCYVHAALRGGHLSLSVGAFDRITVEAARNWVLERLPRATPTDEHAVPISFWSENGYEARSRMIRVPEWGAIAANYPPAVRAEIGALLGARFDSDAAGQLILWHGEPGLGKTYVVRALAWEWRAWCDVHYVTDPETFFGNADYMLDVLLDEPEDDDRWRVLVLEDTGELLSADAKERSGQGLSRFLNVVDGIIGQGLRILLLVTTNEEMRRLHPAVARPGRCAARIEFRPFSEAESAAWLRTHGVEAPAAGSRTLAELYAVLGGSLPAERPRIGFGV